MNLQENFDFLEVVVNVEPGSVDDIGNGRLWYPREGFREQTSHTIEIIATITKSVLDIVVSFQLAFSTGVPFLDTGVGTEVDTLEALGLGDGYAGCDSHCSGAAGIVGPVNEGLGELALTLVDGLDPIIFGVSVAEPIEVREFFSGERDGVQDVHVDALAEGFLEGGFPGLPHDNLHVGSVKVHVEECVAFVRDKELADVRKDEAIFFRAARNVLEVGSGAEGVSGRTEPIRFRPADVVGAPHPIILIEWSKNEGGEEHAEGAVFLDCSDQRNRDRFLFHDLDESFIVAGDMSWRTFLCARHDRGDAEIVVEELGHLDG